jgi:hypothetical protein
MVLCVGMLSASVPRDLPVAHAEVGTQAFANEIQAVRAFFDAYDQHDLKGVFATLDSTGFGRYTDCDYAFLKGPLTFYQSSLNTSRPADSLAEWFRARFNENDRFTVLSTIEGNPGVGIELIRHNDLLDAMGITLHFQSKFGTNIYNGYKVTGTAGVGYGCGFTVPAQNLLHFAQGPSAVRTMVITRAFIDAYNGHDAFRIGELMRPTVVYRACAGTSGQRASPRGVAAVKRFLASRFRHGDRLESATVTIPDPNRANVARVTASPPEGGTVGPSVEATLTITLGGPSWGRIVSVRCSG